MLTASPPPTTSAVNGSLCEPGSPLGGPDPAELLLMGSYLGKPGPPQPAVAQDPRDRPGRPGRRPPSRSPPPASAAQRVHHVYPVLPTPLLRSSRRLPQRECVSLSSRFVITPRRRYPIHQAQYSLLGPLPTVCWNGGHKKAVLSALNSRMVCSPVTVRIAPPDSKLLRSSMPGQTLNTTLSSPSNNVPDPCAKETVLSALKEKKKRTVEEEDQLPLDGWEIKRRRHDSSGSGHSALEPLVAKGVPAAFLPKPGSLKRSLATQSSDDHLHKRPRTSLGSSPTSTCTGGIPSSSLNAITSSYRSTRGLSQLWKRSAGPTSSPFSSPGSSCSQTPEKPAKKTREEEPCHPSSSSAPLTTDKESPREKVADSATGKQQNSSTSPTTSGSSGWQRKRKIQLLPSRRGDQLTLPPPPELGYSITAEDLDMERKASLQWFNKVLEDKTDDAPPWTLKPHLLPILLSRPPCLLWGLPPHQPPSQLLALTPLLESLKKMQDSPAPPSSEPAAAATTAAPSPPKTPSLLTPVVSPLTEPVASTSSDSKLTATFLGLTPTSSETPVTETKSPGVPQAEQSVSNPASTGPSPTPKPSMLLGMLSPPATSSSLATPGPASASPMFKPIFMATPKSEDDTPLPSSSSTTTTICPTPPSPPQPVLQLPLSSLFFTVWSHLQPCPCQPPSP
ncbi:Nuclear envelope pore membrane protein POM 121 [Lemmus lemmus]